MSDWISYEALLTEGYRRCARLTWQYGTTYFWGAVLLPKPQRKHVFAIYALCRLADDIVDLPNGQHSPEPDAIATPFPRANAIPTEPDPTLPDADEPTFAEPDGMHPEPVDGRAAVGARLEDFAQRFRSSLVAGDSTDPVMAAVVHTVITCDIDPECFDRFFGAMAMDLTTTSYQTWEDLLQLHGGLGGRDRRDDAAGARAASARRRRRRHARSDWPFSSPTSFATLTKILIEAEFTCRKMISGSLMLILVNGVVTPEWRAFLAYEIERNRSLYSFADTGIAMLPPRSARCVGTARVLYAQILDEIERNGYDVFSQRARVPTPRKAATAARMMVTGPRTLKKQATLYERSTTDVTQDRY